MDHPTTLPEWQAYIKSLSGQELRDKANAANQVAFVRALEEEGAGPEHIGAIFLMFAQRLMDEEVQLPVRAPGSYLNYASLLSLGNLNVLE